MAERLSNKLSCDDCKWISCGACERLEIWVNIVRKQLTEYEGIGTAKECKHINDGWISVEERLPEVFGKYWITIRYNDGRTSEPIVADFRGVTQKYVVDTSNGREYET